MLLGTTLGKSSRQSTPLKFLALKSPSELVMECFLSRGLLRNSHRTTCEMRRAFLAISVVLVALSASSVDTKTIPLESGLIFLEANEIIQAILSRKSSI